MRVLITGPNGYLARNCLPTLIQGGAELFLLTSSGNIRNNKYQLATIFTSPFELDNLEIDVIIHSAWGGIIAADRNNEAEQFSNFIYTKNILENVNLNCLKSFIFFGSQSEYGVISKSAREDQEAAPDNYYGLYKKFVGEFLKLKANIYNFKLYHLRIFSIYGADQGDKWLIPKLKSDLKNSIKIQISDPSKQVCLMHVDDFSKIISEFVYKEYEEGIYNICGDECLSIRDVVYTLITFLKIESPNVLFSNNKSKTNIVGNNLKLKSQLDCNFTFIDFKKGLDKMYPK